MSILNDLHPTITDENWTDKSILVIMRVIAVICSIYPETENFALALLHAPILPCWVAWCVRWSGKEEEKKKKRRRRKRKRKDL